MGTKNELLQKGTGRKFGPVLFWMFSLLLLGEEISMKKRKWRYGILESLILVGGVYFLFFVLNPIPEHFLTLNIHPLLVVVVMISLRYGNYLGIFSALAASAAYMLSYHQLGRDLYLFLIDFSQYKHLLMFGLAAVIFGRFKDNHDFKLFTAQRRYENLLEMYNELQDGYEKLKFIKEELRKRVLGSEQSIVSLYEIAASLETLDSEEIYTEIVSLMNRYIQAEAVSIYLVDPSGQYLRMKIHAGHEEVVPTSIRIEERPIFKDAIARLTPVKLVDGQTLHGEGPLMVGPIVRDGRVVALINVDMMAFEQVTDYAFHLFKVIVDWVTKALVQAFEVEDYRREQLYFENTAIVKYPRFEHRLEEEKARQEQFGLAYSTLRYPAGGRDAAEVDRLLRGRVRDIDVVSLVDNWIVLLLPATDSDQLVHLRQRLDPILLPKEASDEQ